MELPDRIRDQYTLVAAFVPGNNVPRRTELPVHWGYERSRRIDDAGAAVGVLDRGGRANPVLTRPDMCYDITTVTWRADFGDGFAVLDPNGGAHLWQDRGGTRRSGGLAGHLETIKDLRTNGWQWVPPIEPSHYLQPTPADIEQFTTAVVASEAVAAALAARPPDAVAPSVAAEVDAVGPDTGLGRLGWAWSLAWAAEHAGVDTAAGWRKRCEHLVRNLDPALIGDYHRRVAFTNAPLAMTIAAARACARSGRHSLPDLNDHLEAIRGNTDSLTFSGWLGDVRDRVDQHRILPAGTETLGMQLGFSGLLDDTNDGRGLVDHTLDYLPHPQRRAETRPSASHAAGRARGRRHRP